MALLSVFLGACLQRSVREPRPETEPPSFLDALYVDDDNAADCPCRSTGKPARAACGSRDEPFSCIQDAVAVDPARRPFSKIVVRSGTYGGGVALSRSGASDSKRYILESEVPHGAVIATPPDQVGIYIAANYVTVRGFMVTGGTEGVFIEGAGTGETNRGIGNVVEDVETTGSRSTGVLVRRNCRDTRLTRLDVHHSSGTGLKLDTYLKDPGPVPPPYQSRIRDTVIENCHIHHHVDCGILEGNAERTIIRGNEIDHNGARDGCHGVYVKGFQSLIADNKVHDNVGYGIHLWAAPRGTADRPYLVEGNDVFRNGNGVVVGGNPKEALPHQDLPAGDGMPHWVEVRRNRIHHNRAIGFNYIGMQCDASTNDNLFHNNTVFRNGQAQIVIGGSGLEEGETAPDLRVYDNVVVGPPYEEDPILVFLVNTNLPAGAFEGNVFFVPGASPRMRRGPFWYRCNARDGRKNDVYYDFEQIQASGIEQDNRCNLSSGCGTRPAGVLDSRARWTNPLEADTAPP